jgi:hypothetical protein
MWLRKYEAKKLRKYSNWLWSGKPGFDSQREHHVKAYSWVHSVSYVMGTRDSFP